MVLLMAFGSLGATSGYADDSDRIRRQLDRLNKSIVESRDLPPKTSETIEELRKDLFKAALASRDAKKVFDEADKKIQAGETAAPELEQFRTDIIAVGSMLRILRDRIEQFDDIIENNNKLIADQNRELENLARALDGRPELIQSAVDEHTKALRKEIEALNEKLASRDQRISALEKKGAEANKPSLPAVSAEKIGPMLSAGFDLLAAGKIKEALAQFEQAIELDPASVDARAGQAACYFEMNQTQAAWDIVNAALEVDTKNARALGVKGALLFREGKNSDARKALERAIKADELNAYNHNHLGVVLNSMGRNEAANKSLKRAVELDPEYVTAIYNLSILLATDKKPDLEQALYYYNRALALGSPRQPFMDAALGLK